MACDVGWVVLNFPNLTGVAHLAQGGQKTVFTAHHPIHGPIVLKVFDPSQDRESTEREVLAVSQIQAPSVPRIYEHGTIHSSAGNSIWFCEEFIDGDCLSNIIRVNPLNLDEAISMCRQLLQALKSAEDAHIVHRDVKPLNIMRDRAGNYRLIDFGIARHLDLASLTATAVPFGKLTLGYAPPGQMRNNKPSIDSRSDLFALGITVIEAFTGTNPFYAPPPASQLDVLKRVESQVLAPNFGPSRRGVEFAKFVSALTQKRRDLRPRDAAEAINWLTGIEAIT